MRVISVIIRSKEMLFSRYYVKPAEESKHTDLVLSGLLARHDGDPVGVEE